MKRRTCKDCLGKCEARQDDHVIVVRCPHACWRGSSRREIQELAKVDPREIYHEEEQVYNEEERR